MTSSHATREGPGARDISGETTSAAAIDAARASEYLLLANLLARSPDARLLQQLGGLVGDASPLGVAHIGLAEAAQRLSMAQVAGEYHMLFVGVSRGEVLPYASYYLTGFLNERPLARVRQDMARLGVVRREGVFEPEDHIGSLLETMAGLVGGAFTATPQAADAFLKRHILPWAGRLMTDITAAPSARFYRQVGELGRVWLEIEQASLGLPIGTPSDAIAKERFAH